MDIPNRNLPPPPATIGSPPKIKHNGRPKFEIINKNPVTFAPKQKTKKFRVRGRYGAKELVFITQVLTDLGYSRTNSNNIWDIIWTVRMIKKEFQLLSPFQKVNFMPSMQFICSKNLLHERLCISRNEWMKRYQNTSDNKVKQLATCSFWPLGFNLEISKQFDILLDLFNNNDDLIYIIKKPFSSCGRGVEIIHSVEQLENIKSDDQYLPLDKVKPLAQEYIKDVKLFDGFKFTIRLYVALIGVDPLDVYLFENGLLRICSKRYSLDKDSMNDEFVHIDSIDINKHNQSPENIKEDMKHEGLRCDVKSYLKMLENDYSKEKIDNLWEQMKEIVALSVLSAEYKLTSGVAATCKQRTHTFEILGYDVLIDEQLKPWLLEINHTPSLEPLTTIENKIKKDMIHDLFILADITADRRLEVNRITDKQWNIIQNIQKDLDNNIQPECFVCNNNLSNIDFNVFDKSIVWNLVCLELNDKNRGGYIRILPDPLYLPFSSSTKRNQFIYKWMSLNISIINDIYIDSADDNEFID